MWVTLEHADFPQSLFQVSDSHRAVNSKTIGYVWQNVDCACNFSVIHLHYSLTVLEIMHLAWSASLTGCLQWYSYNVHVGVTRFDLCRRGNPCCPLWALCRIINGVLSQKPRIRWSQPLCLSVSHINSLSVQSASAGLHPPHPEHSSHQRLAMEEILPKFPYWKRLEQCCFSCDMVGDTAG